MGILTKRSQQLAASVEQSCPNREDRSSYDLRDFRGSQTLNLVQDEYSSLLLRESRQVVVEGGDIPSLNDFVVRTQPGIDGDRNLVSVGKHRSCPGASAMHQNDVDGNSIDPRAESRLSTKRLEAAIDLNEDVLDEVLEFRTGRKAPRASPEHASDQTSHRRLMAPEDFRERTRVSLLETLHELFVVDLLKRHVLKFPGQPEKGQPIWRTRQVRAYGQYGLHQKASMRAAERIFIFKPSKRVRRYSIHWEDSAEPATAPMLARPHILHPSTACTGRLAPPGNGAIHPWAELDRSMLNLPAVLEQRAQIDRGLLLLLEQPIDRA